MGPGLDGKALEGCASGRPTRASRARMPCLILLYIIYLIGGVISDPLDLPASGSARFEPRSAPPTLHARTRTRQGVAAHALTRGGLSARPAAMRSAGRSSGPGTPLRGAARQPKPGRPDRPKPNISQRRRALRCAVETL